MPILTKDITKLTIGLKMNYCPSCGEPIQEGAKFCPNCGQKLSEQSEAKQIAKIQEEIHEARLNRTIFGLVAAIAIGIAGGLFASHGHPLPVLIIGFLGVICIPFAILADRKVKRLKKTL